MTLESRLKEIKERMKQYGCWDKYDVPFIVEEDIKFLLSALEIARDALYDIQVGMSAGDPQTKALKANEEINRLCEEKS